MRTQLSVISAVAILVLPSCATVTEPANKSWREAIVSKGYEPIPQPVSAYEAGSVRFVVTEGGFTTFPVGACEGILEGMGVEDTKEAWGTLVQNHAFEFGIFAGLEEGALSSGGEAQIKAGNRTVKNYTANFGEVDVRKIKRAPFESFKPFVTPACAAALDRAEQQGVLDNVYVVAASVQAQKVDYTFNLNPDVNVSDIIEDSEVPDPGSPDVRDYEEKCGTYFKAAGKLLKFFGLGINGANCVSGSSSIQTSSPYYIGHIAYRASDLRRSDALSGGWELSGEPVVELTGATAAELEQFMLSE